ncbi:MAG: hypothetical protein ACE5HO_21910 [bacterium]
MSVPPGDSGNLPPPPDIEKEREPVTSRPHWLYPFDLGLALGIAAALFMLIAMLITSAVNPSGMKLFEDLFAGFNLATFSGRIIGLIWSFGSGFLLGTFTGLLYNLRLRRYFVAS